MVVNISISLAEGESAPAQDVKEILTMLGGDPEKDTINLSISQSSIPQQTAPAGMLPPR